jgi:hypothetical protein
MREFGALVGVWVKEFQESGNPHWHMYVALPETVSSGDFAGLRARTLEGQRLERAYGKFEGRRQLPPIGGNLGGAFAAWLLAAWAGVVGTAGTGEKHAQRGVDVRVCFWKDGASTKDWIEIARYFYKESGKLAQKEGPEDFGPVGRFWGVWGKKQGFVPVVVAMGVSDDVAAELERRMVFVVQRRLWLLCKRDGEDMLHRFAQRRWGDGVTLYALPEREQVRLIQWAERAAEASPGWARQRVAERRQAQYSGRPWYGPLSW